jgi:hypothetical protein
METLNQLYVGPSSVANHVFEPLDFQSYLRRVLLPEVTAALIEDDMECGRDEALQILQDSRRYGLAMFAIQEPSMEATDDYRVNGMQGGGLEQESTYSSSEEEGQDDDDSSDDDKPIRAKNMAQKRDETETPAKAFTDNLFTQRPRPHLRKPRRAVG